MRSYRLYFRSHRSIVARQDFEAESDAAARHIAAAVFDACSDRCDLIELWQDERHVPLALPVPICGFDGLSAAHQEIAIKTEEMIVRSEWTIAASRRLVEQIDRARSRKID